MAKSEQNINYWIKQLGRVELPVMGGVMRELNTVTQADESSAHCLVAVTK